MRRLFLNLLTAILLLLGLAICAAWIRSYWVRDSVDRWYQELRGNTLYCTSLDITMNPGHFMIYRMASICTVSPEECSNFEDTLTWDWKTFKPSSDPDDQIPCWSLECFRFWHYSNPLRNRILLDTETVFTLPYWFLALIFLALPMSRGVLAFRRRRRRAKRKALGLCLTCGYDLRATPGRCPECGSAVPASKT